MEARRDSTDTVGPDSSRGRVPSQETYDPEVASRAQAEERARDETNLAMLTKMEGRLAGRRAFLRALTGEAEGPPSALALEIARLRDKLRRSPAARATLLPRRPAPVPAPRSPAGTEARPGGEGAPGEPRDAVELLSSLAREAERTGVTPGIGQDVAERLEAEVEEIKRRVRTRLRLSSNRCQDPNRLLLSSGARGMVVPRLCGSVRCPACGPWRRSCAMLAAQAALYLDGDASGVWIFELDPCGWDALRQALHRAGAEYTLVRLASGRFRVLATCRVPGDDDARFVPGDELADTIEAFFCAAAPGPRGTRPWRWSRRWGRVHAILKEALARRSEEDWELVAVGRGVPDTTLRNVLRAHGATISADDLSESLPTRGRLLYELPEWLMHEEVAERAGYHLVSQCALSCSPPRGNCDTRPVGSSP